MKCEIKPTKRFLNSLQFLTFDPASSSVSSPIVLNFHIESGVTLALSLAWA